MNKELISQQIIEAMTNDEAFCRAFVSAEDAASVQKVLVDNGFDFSLAQVEEIFAEGVQAIMKHNESDELSEDMLDNVAGGGFLRGTLRLAVSAGVGFGYGCFCGLCPAASAGANYVAGGLAIWTAAGYKKKGW